MAATTLSCAVAQMTEAALLRDVIDLAELLKWRCAHFRPGMNRRGVWSTAMSGTQAAGFPDLIMTRDRLLAVELKAQAGRTTDAQKDWLAALSNAGIECHVFRPAEWADGTIEAILRKRSATPPQTKGTA